MAGSMRGGDRIDEARGVLLVRIGIERIPALGGVGVTIGGREMPGGRVTGLLRRAADRAVRLVPTARALLDVRRRAIARARRTGLPPKIRGKTEARGDASGESGGGAHPAPARQHT